MSGLDVVDFKHVKNLFYALTGEENGVRESQGARKTTITAMRKILRDADDPIEVLGEVDNGIVAEFALSAGVHDSVKGVMMKNVVDLFLNSDSESVASVEVEEVDEEIQEPAEEGGHELPDWLQEMRPEESNDEEDEDFEAFFEESGWEQNDGVEDETGGSDAIDDRVHHEHQGEGILCNNTVRFIYSKWGGRINAPDEASLNHQVHYVLRTLSTTPNTPKLLRKLGKDLKAIAMQVGVVQEEYVSNFRYKNAIADGLELHLCRLADREKISVPEVWPLRKRTRFWGWIKRNWRRVIKIGVVVFGVWGFLHISIFMYRFFS